MLLRLPNNLHYPITITKVVKQAGENVARDEHLFFYAYTTKVTEGSRDGDEREVDKKFLTQFSSSLEGKLKYWKVWEGDVIRGPVDICEVEEDCPHTVQFLGMCTNCGKDMTTVNANSSTSDTDRAPIRMTHDTQYLTISREEANRVDEEAKRRLLAARKLSLVVDLDQTIIHAAVDPTIAEWQKDKENPNYGAVKDVRAFQLIDDGPGMRGCWYYIKLRPGLMEFLEKISRIYELHIYTMGTRQYAQQIASIVDPDRKYFGERILSRDESGSMIAKNLERLFPVDTKMVVIIDDRGDVWKWSANLIRVTPFDFFVGIGDINSSFLPKKQEIKSSPEVKNDTESAKANDKTATTPVARKRSKSAAENGSLDIGNGGSTLEQLVAMGGGDDPSIREMQSKGQEEIITSQLEDKPLFRMQKKLDEEDEAAAASAISSGDSLEIDSTQSSVVTNSDTQHLTKTESVSSSSSSSSNESSSPTDPSQLSPKQQARHSVLRDDDRELIHLESRLEAVHTVFYADYDRKRLSQKGGRVAALSGKRKFAFPSSEHDDENGTPSDLLLIPDVKTVMPAMKQRVLSGVVIVFSGVLPLGTDVQNADISVWAKTFGAVVMDKVDRKTTHVIAARVGTAKVKQAAKRGGSIKVVSTNWLVESLREWKKLDEKPYLLDIGPVGGANGKDLDVGTKDEADKINGSDARGFLLSDSDEEDITGGVDTEDDSANGGYPEKKKLRLDTDGPIESGDEAFVDDGSPVSIDDEEQADIDKELREFMGSDVESDSDADSISSSLSIRGGRKRKRNDGDDDTGSDGDLDRGESTRPRLGERGGTGLKTVANAAGSETGSTRSSSEATPAMINGRGGGGGADDDDNINNINTNNNNNNNNDNNNDNDNNVLDEDMIEREQTAVEAAEAKEVAEEEDSDDELARELERELESAEDYDDDGDESLANMDEEGFMGPGGDVLER